MFYLELFSGTKGARCKLSIILLTSFNETSIVLRYQYIILVSTKKIAISNRHKQQDLMNLLGAMYAAVMFLGGTNTSAVQSVVAVERTVFYRERAAGMYSALPYAFAQVNINEKKKKRSFGLVRTKSFKWGLLDYNIFCLCRWL